MRNVGNQPATYGLAEQGFRDWSVAHWNLNAAHLVEAALERREGSLARNGALVVRTGAFTGRSPKDKFVVRDPSTEKAVDWGPVNQALTGGQFEGLLGKVRQHVEGKDLFVQDLLAGADPKYTLPVRAITTRAWHALFSRQLLIRPAAEQLSSHVPEFSLVFAPDLQAVPTEDGTHSGTCIALSFRHRMVLILGTSYAGELKKSVFTILNYLLPDRRVFPMHCSANEGADGRSALFFGLSGTGKTTLSADPKRRLIGDDEHGWSDIGVFNFEGGCYAKCIRLSREHEPQIWSAIRFGTVLENVVMDTGSRALDFDSDQYTENTRAAYPIDYIDNAKVPSHTGHPSNILFLTADAFGVLPPISRLTPEEAMYHFLSGYTAKLAGTERGLGKEPGATFSACFGAPFLPRHPEVYARMLGEKMRQHQVSCWLVNTGWSGGAYGTGQRMHLPYTRAMVNAALDGSLHGVPVEPHPVFRVLVPKACPEVPAEILDAAGQWTDRGAYQVAAAELAGRFRKNFEKFGEVAPEIAAAAPK
jgi:phosphoenolpyruvate carboxykinase (ATP)